ncbi:MAG: DUF1178 family protein [Sphingomonas sp.]|nr:DUF1178 family protein [Sphingomonas sp.]
MIVFDLRCTAQGHVFEGWFGSSEDYEAQRARGLVTCPICNTGEVEKAPMAPNVGAKSNSAPDPASVKKALAEMADLQKRMLEKSDFVGDRFPDEARAIHLGEAAARAIHGRATREEARTLADEGVPVAPLPFPVVEPGEEN